MIPHECNQQNPDYGTLYNKGSGFFNLNGKGGRKREGGRERKRERDREDRRRIYRFKGT